jgi:CBS domain containing-hemolysin-like protein
VRYSGASIGYQLASILAGAIAPLVAVALLDAWDSTLPVSLYLLAMCLLTVVAVLVARETRGTALESVTATAPELQVTR